MPALLAADTRALYNNLTGQTSLIPQQGGTDSLGELVMHVAEGCNLGCSYCFADEGQYGRPEAKWMTPEDAVRYARSATLTNKAIGRIKFFGGEPLMNLPAIEAAIGEFNDAAEEGRIAGRPGYGAVTNMTIATRRVVDLITQHDFYLTGSIDGPQDVHDAFRTYRDGRGSWKLVDRNIRKLQSETGSPRSLEAVFGPEHLRHGYTLIDIHRYLIENYAPENVIIHIMSREGTVRDRPGWPEFEESVRQLAFDYGHFLVDNIGHATCRVIVADMLKDMRTKTRADAHCSLGIRTQTVTADGVLYPCYTLIEQDDWVMNSDITSRVSEADGYERVQLKLIDNRKSTNPRCSNCEVMTTCQACPGMWSHVNGAIGAVDPTHCSNHVGMTEGVLRGIIDARADRDTWTRVSAAIEAPA
jgi:uncharacterized protein